MKLISILLSIILTIHTVCSKAIDNTKANNSYEVVKGDNFAYKFNCFDDKQFCDKIKNNIKLAFIALSNVFGKIKNIIFYR